MLGIGGGVVVVVVRGHCEKRAVTLKELQIAKK